MANGEVRGLRARGGFEVDMVWENLKISLAVVKASVDRTCRLRTNTPLKVTNSKYICKKDKDGYYLSVFQTKKNKTYKIISDI